ncbi:ABC transporter permease [Bordetella hinzii]|jgi:NitT/TauT family transport system permease protein|uniref:ABC transporter permease n=2 Tax=Bordetella hinzii TaxID=103855 RepID=A0AAN1RZN6_9BORD|nr:ABC transporter permease [Bordetella hinzii]AKQ60595.1 Putative aliphatic sulfonates transport permease protein SsuC [Bordetella hinzii]AZW18368.1 ABC transporter permease [Bordetella hinzii]KCB25780.1 ABC transporter, permease protein [Bordetella hinzii OH87 BAL007II]KCB38935.1 ABC transporter, permease protein [Bordetella hinzii CA90 BAL1384]KCB40302.1 ABC transporter, permease protein [Bordetella hinzii 5132]
MNSSILKRPAAAPRVGAQGAALRRGATALVVPLLILAIWQWAGQSADMAGVLPTPVQVAQAWYAWIFGNPGMGLNPYQGTWAGNVQYSALRVAQGFALAMLAGIPLGLAIGWSRLASRLLDPLIQGLRPIPITAWLPFSIALFGIRDLGAIFLIFLGGFYAIVVNTTQGARDVDRNLVRAAGMMGASAGQLMRRVVLPAAMPSIFTGLRIGLGISWTAVIVSEMVAVKSGLGYVLWDAYYVGRMDIVLADMASIGLMGFLSDRLLVAVEHRVLAWRMLQNH